MFTSKGEKKKNGNEIGLSRNKLTIVGTCSSCNREGKCNGVVLAVMTNVCQWIIRNMRVHWGEEATYFGTNRNREGELVWNDGYL